ncbi:hypothetical protein M422DRAFT_273029 [Sphaerobolus stellatus SS14]|uniref:Uncharacterized protein n=1 Tax=Sphaerobolus stellatus (strain SS14) TaxID=990650 RepID=A0A0C9UA59_SPHS4|nr:hypothetical protein M422DRAFT_273029 [Sphaerobolus stellatus SS14]
MTEHTANPVAIPEAVAPPQLEHASAPEPSSSCSSEPKGAAEATVTSPLSAVEVPKPVVEVNGPPKSGDRAVAVGKPDVPLTVATTTAANGSGKDDKEAEDEELIVDGTVQWKWIPFVETERKGIWSVAKEGVEWLSERLPGYDNVEGPQGVNLAEYEKRLKGKRLQFKKDLADEFMSHFKWFDVKQTLPPNPSKAQVKKAEKRVLKKIDNMLLERFRKQGDAPDMMALLFRTIRKITACNCWAKADPSYKEREHAKMVELHWTPGMNRQTAFPIQMEAHRKLWEALSEGEQQKWEVEALKTKSIEPARADLLQAMAELWAVVGDAWVKRTGWYLEIRTAGIGEDGLPHYYQEKFNLIVVGREGNYSNMPDSHAYDMSIKKALAAFCKVKPEEVKDVATWKPKVWVPKPRGGPLVKFTGTVQLGEKGEILTGEDQLREAINNYMNMSFALCPASREGGKGRPKKPNWNRMWLQGMNNFVDSSRVPPLPFMFDNPERQGYDTLKTMAEWLLKGERGELKEEQCFRWQGQQAGAAIGVRRQVSIMIPCRCRKLISYTLRQGVEDCQEDLKDVKPTPKEEEGEHIDIVLDDEGSTDEDNDDNDEEHVTKRPRPSGDNKRPLEDDIPSKQLKPKKRKVVVVAPGDDEAAVGQEEKLKLMKAKVTTKDKKHAAAAAEDDDSKTAKEKAKKGKEDADADTVTAKGRKVAVTKKVAVAGGDVDESTQLGVETGEDVKKVAPRKRQSEDAAATAKAGSAVAPKKQRKGRSKRNSDSDSDVLSASEALVVDGKPSIMFDGDINKWWADFVRRRDYLDWEENVMEGPMGSPVPLSVRFIEACEVSSPSILRGKLDITAPERRVKETLSDLIEGILLPSIALPSPSILQMHASKHADEVFELLCKRVEEVLVAIVIHASHPVQGAVLAVAGNQGLFPGLRALEFLRRYVQNVDKTAERMSVVQGLLSRYDDTLAKEAWRRWGVISFIQSQHSKAGLVYEAWLVWMETVMRGSVSASEWFDMKWRGDNRPKIVDDILQIVVRRVRPMQPEDFGVPYADEVWSKSEVTEGMEAWSKGMTRHKFDQGSVVEVFVWAYLIYMVAGPGGKSAVGWCMDVVNNTAEWLLELSQKREPDIVEKRSNILKELPKVEKSGKAGKVGTKERGGKVTMTADLETLADSSNPSAMAPTDEVIWAPRKPKSAQASQSVGKDKEETPKPIRSSTRLKTGQKVEGSSTSKKAAR